MSVAVEFYGVPRQRIGIAQAIADGADLGEVLVDLAHRYPRFGETCVDDERLRAGFTANLGGNRFISDPRTPLPAGEKLLILSADAGG